MIKTALGLSLATVLAFNNVVLAESQESSTTLKWQGSNIGLQQLSEEIPGFAGFFYEDGHMYIRLKRNAKINQATDKLNDDSTLSGLQGDYTLLAADYDFQELETLYQASSSILSLPGIVFTDLDERANRIHVAVSSMEVAEKIIAWLEENNLDTNAYIFEETGPLVQQSSLQDESDELRGGLSINFPNLRFSTSNCTLGMTVKRNNVTGFLTNAHCSTTGGLANASNPRETEYTVGDRVIAKEAINLPTRFNNDPRCGERRQPSAEEIERFPQLADTPEYNDCSAADVLFARRIRSVSDDFVLGEIAKPSGEVNSGNLEISGHFTVSGIDTSLAVGDVVHKVGRTTGWTSGKVTRTCVTVPGISAWQRYICQDFADYHQEGGDSGSAVFVQLRDADNNLTDNVNIVGITHGTTDDASVFSPIQGVIDDLGGDFQFTK